MEHVILFFGVAMFLMSLGIYRQFKAINDRIIVIEAALTYFLWRDGSGRSKSLLEIGRDQVNE